MKQVPLWIILLFGFTLTGAGAVVAMRQGPLTVILVLIFTGLFIAVMAALLIDGAPVKDSLTFISVIVAPYVPKIGGRRAGDPPANGGTS